MFRAADKWFAGYAGGAAARRLARKQRGCTRHFLFCVADHFEPFRRRPDTGVLPPATEVRRRIADWVAAYRKARVGLVDADGCGPRHTFFYPGEEYDRECVDALCSAVADGCGEVEIQLHHRNDTAESLGAKLREFRDRLSSVHGLLGRDASGTARYSFVHGNWALCNSRPDGDWCGVNEEVGVLLGTGCYADFTFPSAPSPTQPKTVNALYYIEDTPGRPRAHDRGERVAVAPGDGDAAAAPGAGNRLMLVQGPLAPNWRRRKWIVLPRLENAEISAANPPSAERADLWAEQGIGVAGRPEWVFVKVHTHGFSEENAPVLFGDDMRRMHDHLLSRYNDGTDWVLHYVTARELFNIARAAERGLAGDPGNYRDCEIGAPPGRLR